MNPPLITSAAVNGNGHNGHPEVSDIPADFMPDLPSKCTWHHAKSNKETSPHTKDNR